MAFSPSFSSDWSFGRRCFSLGLAGALVAACSSDPVSKPTQPSGVVAPYTIPAGACTATLEGPAILQSLHVPPGTPVTYNSNPPSSGNHYAIWAAFREYDKPVDRRYYVHSMEHGAVVFLYKCAGPTECPDIVAGLRRAIDAMPKDPLCSDVKNRIILTPDPLIDTKVAVAAWGFTYEADCVDQATLVDFAKAHYARAPEDFCSPGQADF
jgi:hypothetical protein